MVKNEQEDANVYQLTTIDNYKKINIKKVAIMILIFIIVIMLMVITSRATYIIKQTKMYEQYEAQLAALKVQEEQRLAELEKIRQSKIPKLTQTRKRQFSKYLPF